MSPTGVKKMMHLNALSGELDGDMDAGLESEMPSAEAGGETVTRDTHGEVASALGVLTGIAKAAGEAAKSEVGSAVLQCGSMRVDSCIREERVSMSMIEAEIETDFEVEIESEQC